MGGGEGTMIREGDYIYHLIEAPDIRCANGWIDRIVCVDLFTVILFCYALIHTRTHARTHSHTHTRTHSHSLTHDFLLLSLGCFTTPGQQNWVLGLLRSQRFGPSGTWQQALPSNPTVIPAVKQGCYIQYHRLFAV